MSKTLRTKALILTVLLAATVAATAAATVAPATVAKPVPPDGAPLARVRERVLPAYMFIGGGSGVVISPDGYVITNAHVVQRSKRWRLRAADGKTYTADVVGRAPLTDLALLKIRGNDLPPHVTLGDSDRLRPGQTVIAVGNPFRLGDIDGVPSVSLGSVSAIGVDRPNARDCVVTDTAINPGNSGGPLVTADGVMVGVTGQVATRFGIKANTGVGYAISVNQVRRYLPALRAAGGKVISPGSLEGVALVYAVDKPARVRKVTTGSRSAKAGLRAGDVIKRLGLWPVRTSGHLVALLSRYPAGTTVDVIVSRGGKPLRLRLPLGTPVPGAVGVVFDRKKRTSLRIERVVRGGPADRAGIRSGDVVYGVGGFLVNTRKDVRARLAEASAGQILHMTIRRKGKHIPMQIRLVPATEVKRLMDAGDLHPAGKPAKG